MNQHKLNQEIDKMGSENPYSNNYAPHKPEDSDQKKTYGGSIVLAIFFICYAGYEIWFQWDFKQKWAFPVAVAALVLLFFLLAALFSSISLILSRKWGKIGSWIAFFVGFELILVTSYYFNPEVRHDRWVKKFDKQINEYVNLKPVVQDDQPDILKGKVVVVEMNRNGKPPRIISDRLQRYLRADSPEEVSTVILLRWGQKKVPKDINSVVETCSMTAIHKSSNKITAEKYFEADWRLVNHKSKGKIWMGHLPDTLVIEYITNLPHKTN